MERAIIHSDLKKKEIHPSNLLKKYLNLLEADIRKIFLTSSIENNLQPANELDVNQVFSKMGMNYIVTRPKGNIFISPRPSEELLKTFYLKSSARKFWLNELWSKTQEVRLEKIILPQLEWCRGFIDQYTKGSNLNIIEFMPNHWGYLLAANSVLNDMNYKLIDILFDTSVENSPVTDLKIVHKVENNSIDNAFLFEAIDRSPNPSILLERVKKALKPKGLCFITCLLSSGFEVQMLGEDSEIFVPPERMNLYSFEGMLNLVEETGGFEVLEFSTPGVLDIPNVIKKLDLIENSNFLNYILNYRQDPGLVVSFQDFLQLNRLGTFGRLVLKKCVE